MESNNTSTKKNYLNLLVVVFTPAIVFTILGLCFMIPGLFASKSTGQIDKDTANDLVGTYYAKTNGIRYQKLTVSKSHPDTITIPNMDNTAQETYKVYYYNDVSSDKYSDVGAMTQDGKPAKALTLSNQNGKEAEMTVTDLTNGSTEHWSTDKFGHVNALTDYYIGSFSDENDTKGAFFDLGEKDGQDFINLHWTNATQHFVK